MLALIKKFRTASPLGKTFVVLAIIAWAIIIVLVAVNLNNVGLPEEECSFQFPHVFNCMSYEIKQDSLELNILNGAGRNVTVREIKVKSGAIKGGECTTGEVEEWIQNGKPGSFSLKSPSGDACTYMDTGRSVNFYEIEVNYLPEGYGKSEVTAGKIVTLPGS